MLRIQRRKKPKNSDNGTPQAKKRPYCGKRKARRHVISGTITKQSRSEEHHNTNCGGQGVCYFPPLAHCHKIHPPVRLLKCNSNHYVAMCHVCGAHAPVLFFESWQSRIRPRQGCPQIRLPAIGLDMSRYEVPKDVHQRTWLNQSCEGVAGCVVFTRYRP
jgi:hypothetical protein